jgi:fumarylacetoacetate (FAA) hydrolase family protein
MLTMRLTPENSLPADGLSGTLIARVWLPGPVPGPVPALVTPQGVFSLFEAAPTVAQLLEAEEPLAAIRRAAGERLGDVASLLANTAVDQRDPARPFFLAPADLQAIKACGVTFVRSMLERVIESAAGGDPDAAARTRAVIEAEVGESLASVRPGSAEARRVKSALQARGLWSPFMEVGIGPDAELFTKSQPMSAAGPGEEVGILPTSTWNNPEPEVVLVVNARGRILGATLGNDVNIRDMVGRSLLLACRAKDNRASTALGPFLRLFDERFTLDDVRRLRLELTIEGEDGFRLAETHDMAEMSRDVTDVVSQCLGPHNQYPDGLLLFTGTSVAPAQDRDGPGKGFTHHVGDIVTIGTPRLGALINRVNHTHRISPWTFGVGRLLESVLARREESRYSPASSTDTGGVS